MSLNSSAGLAFHDIALDQSFTMLTYFWRCFLLLVRSEYAFDSFVSIPEKEIRTKCFDSDAYDTWHLCSLSQVAGSHKLH